MGFSTGGIWRLDDFTGRNPNDDVSMVAVRFDGKRVLRARKV